MRRRFASDAGGGLGEDGRHAHPFGCSLKSFLAFAANAGAISDPFCAVAVVVR